MRQWMIGMVFLSCVLSGCAAGIVDESSSGGGGSSALPELVVSQVAGTRATITWTEPADVANYEVRFLEANADLVVAPAVSWDEMTAVADPPEPVGELNAVRFVVPGLWPNRTYTVAVRYVADGVTSDASTADVDTSLTTVSYISNTAGLQMGSRIAAGDINGDGIADVTTGSFFGEAERSVSLPIFLGGSDFDATPDIEIASTEASTFGFMVAIGDVDCDGVDDLLVGDPKTPAGEVDSGQVAVFSGGADIADVTSQAQADVVILDKNEHQNSFGWSIVVSETSAGGCVGVQVGAPEYPNGLDNGALYFVPAPFAASSFRVTDAMRTDEGEAAGDMLGMYASPLGDIDGGGATDAAFVSVYGRDAGDPLTIAINGPDIGTAFDIDLVQTVGGLPMGNSAAGGDINADGYPDLIVGQPDAVGGTVRIYFGSAAFGPSVTPVNLTNTTGQYWGISVATADVDNDGEVDLLVGSGEGIAIYANPVTSVSTPEMTLSDVSALALVLADVDGDGYDDFLTGNGFGGEATSGELVFLH